VEVTRRNLFKGSAAFVLAGAISRPFNAAEHFDGKLEMILGIDNIGLATHDLARSVDFYEKLGFVKADQNERGCTMVIGTTKLFMFPAGPQKAAATRATTLVGNPPGIDHISFLVDDVDRSFSELSARGIQFTSIPEDQTWGARTAVLQDPDGNNLYLLTWRAKK
jgi:methylmalonyl-CoA/ethylmalonyl-CoA epimerase